MDAALGALQWVVSKALAPVADGVLEAWESSKNLGLNIEALSTELLLVQATLETASRKQLGGQAMETLLQKLRDSAHNAEDLLDELDYFRIHDELHGTSDAANEHANGGVHNLVLNAHHTTKALGKLLGLSVCSSAASPVDPREEDASQQVSCCTWPRARQTVRGNSSSAPNANQGDVEVSGCMPKLGKLLPRSSFIHVNDDDSRKSTLCGAPEKRNAKEIPKLVFNRVVVSERMKHIVEQLRPLRREFTTVLQNCGRNTVPDTAHSRLITNDQSIEPKLYGRDRTVNNIIHDITKVKYCDNISVLPIVGPGGIGKTTMIQHIYHKQDVQNHFQVMIWVCVSLSFNLNKLLEEINEQIPRVEGEKKGRPKDLIAQRLKSKRFLLVLDDMWECRNEDDWNRLLLPLKTSQQKGSMILVTTRFPAIAQIVKTTHHSIELKGLESEEFRKLFLAFIFGDEQCKRHHIFLLETGEKIMEKLKGSPLAAKTVGRLLRKNLSLGHWRRVLENKEWEKQTGNNDIMPALKLSYDYLPFHLQQSFSYSALFPEDYHFGSSELINLWIGLGILQPNAQNQTYEEIGLSNLNDLVTHGFLRVEETVDGPSYVMHDLLHDLALKVASHECLSLHRSNAGSVRIQPCIRHLSITIDDVGNDSALSGESFKNELRKLKTKFNVERLETLMLFGNMDESFASILCELFREATALRVLHFPSMSCSVESIIHNFSALIHLRYLCLGTVFWRNMHLPLTISRFYHLRILDLARWYGSCEVPKDMSNLAKLCRFYTQSDELHSNICNVGKLKLLEELKVFRVNKESEGFELKQLEHLTELRELGIYNIEKIHSKEAAAEAKLMEKNYLQRLTLKWYSNAEPDVEALVFESLQPHRNLQELYIIGHGGPSCPTWLGAELAVEALRSLHLDGVSWEVVPSLGKMWDLSILKLESIVTLKEFVIEQSFCRLISLTLIGLTSFEKWVPGASAHLFPLLQVLIIRNCPKLLELPFSNHIVCPPEQDQDIEWLPNLQELEIAECPEFLLVAHIPWTKTLCSVKISSVKLLEELDYSKLSSGGKELKITGKEDLHSFDQVLASSILTEIERMTLEKCLPLELKHVRLLTSLKTLMIGGPDGLVGPSRGQGDVEWQLPVECLIVRSLGGASGKELTELLRYLPRLSKLVINECKKITRVVVGVDLRATTSTESEVEQEKDEDGVLYFSAHLSDSLRELQFYNCPELVLVDPPTLIPNVDVHNNRTGGGRGGEGLQALRSLQIFSIQGCPKFLFACSFSSPSFRLFPSSLQFLYLRDVKGMETLKPLSNLTSLTQLEIYSCKKDLRCEGLLPLLTAGGQLTKLEVKGSPGFFAGWDLNPSRVLQDGEGEAEHQLQLRSPHLQQICTDDAVGGLLAAPICSFLSSSLTKLSLQLMKEMECFSKEQEDALHLLASLQELKIQNCYRLQHLPAGLHKLTNLKRLLVAFCSAVHSLPKDGLPKSLQDLDVGLCGSEELKQQCRGLAGTI